MEYPFDHLPSTEEIVQYYVSLRFPRYLDEWEGQDMLWRDDEDGSYLYIIVDTYIDYDEESVAMLDVRTNVGGTEMRDKLYVQNNWELDDDDNYNYISKPIFERREQPIPFFCEHGCGVSPCEHTPSRMAKYSAEYHWFADMLDKHRFRITK